MTDRLRAVFDTNVFVSAFLSRNPTGPTQELFRRWENGEFILLISDALLEEIAETLLARRISAEKIGELLTLLSRLAEWVNVPVDAIQPVVLADPDDDPILACAVAGRADFLVTYDSHFDPLGGEHAGIRITRALPFLWALRGESAPEES